MFYKLSNLETSHEDWISLNTDRVDGELIVKACGECPFEEIEWINPTEVGEDDDPPQLYGGLVPAQRLVYTISDTDAQRPELRKALDESGFEMFEVRHEDCPVEFFFGIDGGGYSFLGAHWIPLRARLAAMNEFLFGDELRALLEAWEKDMERQGESLASKCPEVYQALFEKLKSEEHAAKDANAEGCLPR